MKQSEKLDKILEEIQEVKIKVKEIDTKIPYIEKEIDEANALAPRLGKVESQFKGMKIAGSILGVLMSLYMGLTAVFN